MSEAAGLGSALDAARARVADDGLTPQAVGLLTEVVSGLSLEALGPVKQLLKRFFSSATWSTAEDDALADAVGSGSGHHRHELEPGLVLEWGWDDGRFRLRVEAAAGSAPVADAAIPERADLTATFDGEVTPEATPSPRTIRFVTPPLHHGASRSYDADAMPKVDDPRAARLLQDFDDITNVLVGPDFVAVTIARPGQWPLLLGPMLHAVAEEFTDVDAGSGSGPPRLVHTATSTGRTDAPADSRAPRRLERAWSDLGRLRGDDAGQLEQILAAATDAEPARRQVAAALLAGAPPDAADRAWRDLFDDPSRSVRRSVVDAVADAGRDALRPLLEHALDDTDAWTRWKALRGLGAIGVGPSRAAIEVRADDPDFRVRLEAAQLLAGASTGET